MPENPRKEVVRNSRIRDWDDVADITMINFSVSGHLSAFERGDLKGKGKGKLFIHFKGSDETVEVLSVYAEVAAMCEELAWEMSKCSKDTANSVALANLETTVMPPEVSTTDPISPTDTSVQGNLLREHEQKLASLPEHLQLTKLCSYAGLAKTVEEGLHFTTRDDTELDRLKGSCRQNFPRSNQSFQVKGWIRRNTKIGPVLDVTVSYHQRRCGVEIMIESLFGDNLLVVQDRERDKQIRNGDLGRDSR